MAEMLILLIMVAIAGGLVAVGALLGSWFSRRRRHNQGPPNDWRNDFAAASRTVQRLADEGVLDEETRAKLLEMFRQGVLRREHLTESPFGHSQVDRGVPSPSADAPETPVLAEIVEESDKPPLAEERELAKSPPPDLAEPSAETPSFEQAASANSSGLHPLDRPPPTTPVGPTPAQKRKRAIADVLQAFMEDKNIRWGEVVSGMLIVGCSIALAISLRREIESLSERFIYLPALLFMAATGAIHAAGNYTLRRWNLRATSRGVLIIATLLVPVNFLATIIVTGPESKQLPPFHPLYLTAIAVGFLAFGTMTYFAAQALLRAGRWQLWLGVMGTSAGQVLISRLSNASPSGTALWSLSLLPLTAFLVAAVGQLVHAARLPRFGFRAAGETLLVFGATTFALAAPMGLLLSRVESLRDGLAWLSIPLSVPSVVLLATGLMLQRRSSARRLGMVRTTGTALAVFGGFLLVANVLLAWPQPDLLITIGVATFVTLTVLATTSQTPILHVPAIACGTLAGLVGFHQLQGAFNGYEDVLSRRLLVVTFSGGSSILLSFLAFAVSGVGILLYRRVDRQSGRAYLLAGCGIAGLALAAALSAGFLGSPAQDPQLASPVLLLFAFVLISASSVRPIALLSWAGAALLFLALIQSLAFNPPLQAWLAELGSAPRRPFLVATLLHGILCSGWAALLARRVVGRRDASLAETWRRTIWPLTSAAMISSGVSLPAAALVESTRFADHTGYVLALALTWLLTVITHQRAYQFVVFQALGLLAAMIATSGVCQRLPWWGGRLLDTRHLAAQFAAVAVWSLLWSLTRRLCQDRWPRAFRLMRTAFDELVLVAGVATMFAWAVTHCWQGAARELGLISIDRALGNWQQPFGAGAWLAAGLMLAAVSASMGQRSRRLKLAALLLVLGIPPLLIAARFSDSVAVASAWRWAFAAYGAIVIAAIHRWRKWLDTTGGELAATGDAPKWLAQRASHFAAMLALALTAIPILGLTTLTLAQAAAGNPLGGPIADTFFARIGSELSFGFPLSVLVGILLAEALRQRNPVFMLAGSAVFQYLVNLAFFLPILKSPDPITGWPLAIGCLQWNALGAAVFTSVWQSLRHPLEPVGDTRPQLIARRCLPVQIQITLAAVIALSGLATAVVVATPWDLTRYLALGGWQSHLACLLGLVVAMRAQGGLGITLLLAAGAVFAGPLAITIEGAPGSWRGFHFLMVAWLVVAATAAVLAWTHVVVKPGTIFQKWTVSITPQPSRATVEEAVRWSTAFLVLSLALAIRATPHDPQSPWWSFGSSLAAAFVAASLGVRLRSQWYAYLSTLIVIISVTIAWWGAWPNRQLQGLIELLQLSGIAVALAGIGWCLVEIRAQSRKQSGLDRTSRLVPLHRLAIASSSILLLVLSALGFFLTGLLEAPRSGIDVGNLCGGLMWLAVAALAVCSLWDQRSRLALPSLSACGFAAICLGLDELDQRLGWGSETAFIAATVSLAVMLAAVGHAWRFAANIAVWGTRFQIANPVARLKSAGRWLPYLSLLLAAMTALADFWVVLTFAERWMRIAAAFTPLPMAYGISCFAQRQRRQRMQQLAIFLVILFAFLASWADIAPSIQSTYVLERAVRALVALAAMAFLLSVPISRWSSVSETDWSLSVRQSALRCAVAAAVTLLLVLSLEVLYFEPGVGVPFGHPYQVWAVAITLVGLIVASLSLALRDRLGLTFRTRTGCVYMAQLIAALLFAHFYLSNPQLFGTLQPYWPYIVMAIAFAGVGAGELFQRSGLRVMAEPFQVTGGLLPLLPAVGWWANREVGIETAGHYSLLLFLVGLLYATLSMLRRSFVSGLAAAIAGNAALWALLADQEPLSVLRHPQFWFVPPAVSLLVAAHLQRERLTEAQLTAIRYVCLLLIYVSSTADVFLEGVGDSLWEPMVLAALSVAGVFVGVGLRIRAFLYLGATFVFMSVIGMVWHAYANVQHVAIWWGFGILLGVLILTVFGIFEKKRAELLQLVAAMRDWEA